MKYHLNILKKSCFKEEDAINSNCRIAQTLINYFTESIMSYHSLAGVPCPILSSTKVGDCQFNGPGP